MLLQNLLDVAPTKTNNLGIYLVKISLVNDDDILCIYRAFEWKLQSLCTAITIKEISRIFSNLSVKLQWSIYKFASASNTIFFKPKKLSVDITLKCIYITGIIDLLKLGLYLDWHNKTLHNPDNSKIVEGTVK